jgi:TonB family protein
MPRGGAAAPVYPARARRAGIEARRRSSCCSSRAGACAGAAAPLVRRRSLDVAALDAVERWRFEPPPEADWRGRWFLVPIKFRLQ